MMEVSKGKMRNFNCLFLAVFPPLIIIAFFNPSTIHRVDLILTSFQTSDLSKYILSHRFLTGAYQPVSELHSGVVARVLTKTSIPFDLNGIFIRNGPNPPRTEKLYHWFDGHGMIHSIVFDPKKSRSSATYSNAYVPTPRFLVDSADGSEYFANVGEARGIIGLIKFLLVQPIISKLLYLYGKVPSSDSKRLGQANTHTLMVPDGRFYLLHEGSLPFEATLNEMGSPVSGSYQDFSNTLDFPFTAHPRLITSTVSGLANSTVKPSTALVFFGYSGDPSDKKRANGNSVKFGEMDIATNKLKYYHGLSGFENHTPFMHDFIVTDRHIVFFRTSVKFDPIGAFFGKDETEREFFKFDHSLNLKIGVVSRIPEVAMNVTWFELPFPAVVVHTLNGWDVRDNKIVAWAPMGFSFDGSLKDSANKYYMTQFTIDLSEGTVTHDIISKAYNLEFPRVRDECVGKPCRYGFSGVLNNDNGEAKFTGFVRLDTQTKSMCHTPYRWGKRLFVGGEPVVIPKEKRIGSDEVYIGTFLIDEVTGENYFAAWDGQRCGDDAVVVLEVPRVPLGFHGNWISSEQMARHLKHTGVNE